MPKLKVTKFNLFPNLIVLSRTEFVVDSSYLVISRGKAYGDIGIVDVQLLAEGGVIEVADA